MKLLQYTSRIYLFYSLAIFIIASALIYVVINHSINEELHERLELTRDMLKRQLKQGHHVKSMPPYWEIYKIDRKPLYHSSDKDTLIYLEFEDEEVVFRQEEFIRKVDNQLYKMIIRTPKTGREYLLFIIAAPTFLIIIFLLVSLILINALISKRIWSPFYKNLSALSAFSIMDNKNISLQESKIDEFEQLRDELQHLTDKLRRDYTNLKRFTENASHELQTPLSVMITRLEQLMNKHKLSPSLAKEIGNVFNSAKRLTKLNKTLLILSKIENRQYDMKEELDIVPLFHQQMDQLVELIDMKSLKLKMNVDEKVLVNANSDLVEIFIGNLLSNAIKHNHPGGEINIELNEVEFSIENSGKAFDEDPNRLFGRFVKADPSSSSHGLGLALVKEIAELFGWSISYTVKNHFHCLRAEF